MVSIPQAPPEIEPSNRVQADPSTSSYIERRAQQEVDEASAATTGPIAVDAIRKAVRQRLEIERQLFEIRHQDMKKRGLLKREYAG